MKHILVTGGCGYTGTVLTNNLIDLGNKVTVIDTQWFGNYLTTNKKLNIIKLNFANYGNFNIEKLITTKFTGKYDSIINLVGYIDNKGFEKTNLNSILKSLTINAIIPILIEKMLVKRMLSQKWGRILNCSSVGVKFGGGKNSYNYSLSKHCLEFIPNSYKNWAKKNVFINNLRIGVTDTKIHKKMKNNLNMKERLKFIPINRMARPKEMAVYIANLTTDNNSYMTGQTLTASGGE